MHHPLGLSGHLPSGLSDLPETRLLLQVQRLQLFTSTFSQYLLDAQNLPGPLFQHPPAWRLHLRMTFTGGAKSRGGEGEKRQPRAGQFPFRPSLLQSPQHGWARVFPKSIFLSTTFRYSPLCDFSTLAPSYKAGNTHSSNWNTVVTPWSLHLLIPGSRALSSS